MIRAAILIVLLAGCTPLRVNTDTRMCLGLCVWAEQTAEAPPVAAECRVTE
jgi:hypothetical protein